MYLVERQHQDLLVSWLNWFFQDLLEDFINFATHTKQTNRNEQRFVEYTRVLPRKYLNHRINKCESISKESEIYWQMKNYIDSATVEENAFRQNGLR